ncbi:MAG: sulfite exporter TauE/SafE family protein [Pseudomonadota bacterium]
MLLISICIIVVLAIIAGFLAGLFGIGGGLIIVPGLYYTFTLLGYDETHLMHVAIGTSLATIMATGLSSSYAHCKKGSVDFNLIQQISPGLVSGVILGTMIAAKVDSLWLKSFFVPALIILAMLMLFKPKGNIQSSLPAWPITTSISIVIGFVSSLMGIGGAALNVPFMSLHRVTIHKAIGSAAAMGILISIIGSVGFIVIGTLEQATALPPFTIGYINWLALLIIMPITILMAPVGVNFAHRVPVNRLKKIFSIFLFFLALRMAYEIYSSTS